MRGHFCSFCQCLRFGSSFIRSVACKSFPAHRIQIVLLPAYLTDPQLIWRKCVEIYLIVLILVCSSFEFCESEFESESFGGAESKEKFGFRFRHQISMKNKRTKREEAYFSL
jgi:hypothetical protein